MILLNTMVASPVETGELANGNGATEVTAPKEVVLPESSVKEAVKRPAVAVDKASSDNGVVVAAGDDASGEPPLKMAKKDIEPSKNGDAVTTAANGEENGLSEADDEEDDDNVDGEDEEEDEDVDESSLDAVSAQPTADD